MPKVVKSVRDYEEALATIDRLITLDPEAETAEANELAVLTVLVRDYERARFPIEAVDPIEAVRFRMEQMGLSQRDLVPFIGTRARVSEVLSRKRSLTLNMLRALHTGLGIPASVLLNVERQSASQYSHEELTRFPVKEIRRRGWLALNQKPTENEIVDALKSFLRPLNESLMPAGIRTRRTQHVRSDRPMDRYALLAWTARAIDLARTVEPPRRFDAAQLADGMIDGLVHLSVLPDGPRRACEYLLEYGITLVVVPHLPGTHLDGAVFLMTPDRPVIALTLRYDRLDNFWFTLLHEMGHLRHDLKDDSDGFFDDLNSLDPEDESEARADNFAQDHLIRPEVWNDAPARRSPIPEYVRRLAAQLGIHPAIVAGRVRRERGAYRILGNLVGHAEVRVHFRAEMEEALR